MLHHTNGQEEWGQQDALLGGNRTSPSSKQGPPLSWSDEKRKKQQRSEQEWREPLLRSPSLPELVPDSKHSDQGTHL